MNGITTKEAKPIQKNVLVTKINDAIGEISTVFYASVPNTTYPKKKAAALGVVKENISNTRHFQQGKSGTVRDATGPTKKKTLKGM